MNTWQIIIGCWAKLKRHNKGRGKMAISYKNLIRYAMYAQLANGIGDYRFFGTSSEDFLDEMHASRILYGYYEEYLGDEDNAKRIIARVENDAVLFFHRCKQWDVFMNVHIIKENITWNFYTEGQMFNEYWKDSLRRNWEEQKYIKDMPADMYKAYTSNFYISKVIIPINIYDDMYDYAIDFHTTREDAVKACTKYRYKKNI